jgi:hypothetical protein
MSTARLVELDGVGHAAVADGPGRASSQGEADAGVDVEAFALAASAIRASKAGDCGRHRSRGREESGGDESEFELHGDDLVAG